MMEKKKMNEQRQKSNLLEIVEEMGNDIKKITKSSFYFYKKSTDAISEIQEFIVEPLFFGITAAHFFPSFVRYEKNLVDNVDIGLLGISPNTIGILLGGMSGFCSLIYQPYIYCNAFENKHPEALLIPVATNLASGIYEWYRHSKNKLIEKKNRGK